MDEEKDFAELVGSIIKEIRLEKNFSQQKLAELSNLDMTYISMIERGKRNITLKTLMYICIAFEMEIGKFFSRVENHIKYPF